MKTKLPLSSNSSAKNVIKSYRIFSFLFILLITFSSFGQSFIIESNCGTSQNSDFTFQFDTQNTTGDNLGSVISNGTVLATDFILRVELADPSSGTNNYDRWEVLQSNNERWFYTTDTNLISDPCNATWAIDFGASAGDAGCSTISICPPTSEDTTWYEDSDSDTFGNPNVSQVSETQPTGYVLNNTDCDDNDDTVNATTTYYVDADSDGYGTTAEDLCEVTAPVGYAILGGDCDDDNTAIYPGATEVCDGFDNNCDGNIDEGLTDCDDNQDIYDYCGDKSKENKVIICHNGKDKCVNLNALDAHLAHGDTLGSCISGKISNDVGDIIEESPTTFDVAFWPNPSNNNFNVKMITPNGNIKVSIKAFDINGRLVHSNLINGNQNYKFGNNLSAGIYIVKLTQESTTKMIKLVKQ